LYDGTLLDEKRFCVLGGDAEGIAARLTNAYRDDLDVGAAVRVAVEALSGSERKIVATDLEVATLVRNGKRRAFTRLSDDVVAQAVG
jgi:proteasome alpha subunit